MSSQSCESVQKRNRYYLTQLLAKIRKGTLTVEKAVDSLESWVVNFIEVNFDMPTTIYEESDTTQPAIDALWYLPFKVVRELYGDSFMKTVLMYTAKSLEDVSNSTIYYTPGTDISVNHPAMVEMVFPCFSAGSIPTGAPLLKLISELELMHILHTYSDLHWRTPLHLACQSAWKHGAAIIQLIEPFTIPLTLADRYGNTPLHMLSLYDLYGDEPDVVGYSYVISTLAMHDQYNEALVICNHKGRTPLHEACININDVSSIARLLETAEGRIACKASDHDGKTPYDYFVDAEFLLPFNSEESIEKLKAALQP